MVNWNVQTGKHCTKPKFLGFLLKCFYYLSILEMNSIVHHKTAKVARQSDAVVS